MLNKTKNKEYQICDRKKYAEQFYQKYHIQYEKINKKLFVKVNNLNADKTLFTQKKQSFWCNVFKILLTSPMFIISTVILLSIFILTFVFSNGKVAQPRLNNPGTAPANCSLNHLFGLGFVGEEYWNEVWIGTKWTIFLTICIVSIQLFVGLLIGSIWGYFKKTDIVFINLINIINLIPSLIFILLIITLAGIGFWPIIIAVSIQSWISFAVATRVQVMLVRNYDYNVMSKILGTNSFKIILRNILPRIAPVITSIGAFAIPDAISWDLSLSYLNFGFVDGETTTSLGYLIQYTLNSNKWFQFPNLIIFPIAMVVIISFFFFSLCHKISDSLNPKNHNKISFSQLKGGRK